MVQVTLSEAMARLGELVSAAKSGEQVVILDGPEGVQLVPVPVPAEAPHRRRRFGSAAGLIHMAPDFDAPLEDFTDYLP